MKQIASRVGAVVLVVILVFIFQSCDKIEPGYVGIKVNLYGDQKGVDDYPVLTGRIFVNPLTEELFKYPTFMQRAAWTKADTEGSPNNDEISFNAKGGITLYSDIAVAYKFPQKCVPQMFIEFRQPADVLTQGFMRDRIRDAFNEFAGSMEVIEILNDKQALVMKVTERLQKQLTEKCMLVDSISILGDIRFGDPRVSNSINAVLAQQQAALQAEAKEKEVEALARMRKETAVGEANAVRQTANAEAEAILTKATAQAQANDLLSKSLTESLIRYRAIDKWNGSVPTVTSGSVPIIDLR
jgi:regulator of protease activity HflC (stomatin/prohibitin superfamily)